MAAFSDLSVHPKPRDRPAFSIPAVSNDTGLPFIKPGCQAKLRENHSSSWLQPDHTPCQEAVNGLWEAKIKQVKNLERIQSGCAGHRTTSGDRGSRMVVASPSLQHCCCSPGVAFPTRVTISVLFSSVSPFIAWNLLCSYPRLQQKMPWVCPSLSGKDGRPRMEQEAKSLTRKNPLKVVNSYFIKELSRYWTLNPWEQEAYLQKVVYAANFHLNKEAHFYESHGAAMPQQWKFAWIPKTKFCRVSHLCVRKRRSSLLVPNSSISRPKSVGGWYKKNN